MNPNLITSIIFLLLIGAGLYGIYALIGRGFPGKPQVFAGVILILIFIVLALHFLGIHRLGATTEAPAFRYSQLP